MNYNKIYEQLIERAKLRVLEGYKESHHIIPRCLGGTDDKSNLVNLTPEEHYLAHQLLVKIYPNNDKLIYAATCMVASRPSNKLYGWLRRKLSLAKSKEQSGEGNSQYGTYWAHDPVNKVNWKFRKDEELPSGWVLGKFKLPKEKSDKQLKKLEQLELKRILKINLYSEYHEIYKRVGFDEFVRITGYNKSKQNLVQVFSRLVETFIPQNGKKRAIPF